MFNGALKQFFADLLYRILYPKLYPLKKIPKLKKGTVLLKQPALTWLSLNESMVIIKIAVLVDTL